VLVTRPREQAADMVQQLEQLGGQVSILPTVRIGDPPDWGPVDRAIAEIGRYQWLVFTSVNGVVSFLRRWRQSGRTVPALSACLLAAIGPATAEALRQQGLEPAVVPTVFTSEGLAAALKERAAGQRVLLARADRGREVLREELSAVAKVEQVAVYSQSDAPPDDPIILAQLREGTIDFVTLTSANIARVWIDALDDRTREQIHAGRLRLVTISPVTSAVVRERGLPVAAEAAEATVPGVIAALVGLARAAAPT
jgi:uroporphyrinogen III methyltransferase/synthase